MEVMLWQTMYSEEWRGMGMKGDTNLEALVLQQLESAKNTRNKD